MHINSLIESYAVSGQIQPSDIAVLKDAGFVSIVCNRPDEEVSGDESSAAIKRPVWRLRSTLSPTAQ